MKDVNGREVLVGDKAPGRTVIGLVGDRFHSPYSTTFERFGGYTILDASKAGAAPPGKGADSGWWTCFPRRVGHDRRKPLNPYKRPPRSR